MGRLELSTDSLTASESPQPLRSACRGHCQAQWATAGGLQMITLARVQRLADGDLDQRNLRL